MPKPPIHLGNTRFNTLSKMARYMHDSHASLFYYQDTRLKQLSLALARIHSNETLQSSPMGAPTLRTMANAAVPLDAAV